MIYCINLFSKYCKLSFECSKESSEEAVSSSDGASNEDCKPVFTLEMCMTQLDCERASVFYKSNWDAVSTIHVAPEDGFSYASFEAMGYGPQDVELMQLVERVLICFKPRYSPLLFTFLRLLGDPHGLYLISLLKDMSVI